MGKIRGTHSSPGIYTQITDLNYATKTLGVTTLGLVGETLKGPAFEPIMVTNYSEFQDYFGGTSAEKFKDSSYPKYELPYIAKSYLSASDQLYVCRVLGLSGYNAGPAFVITAEGDNGKYVIAVLRSRGSYRKYANIGTDCQPISKYDELVFDCDNIKLLPYQNLSMVINNCGDISTETGTTEFAISMLNFGQFTIKAFKGEDVVGTYPVSLNPGAKDYIYDVLGSKANEGTAPLFVEELYDLRLIELIEKQEVYKISSEVTKMNELQLTAVCDPVKDFVRTPYTELRRSHLGLTFLCDEAGDNTSGETANGYMYYPMSGTTISGEPVEMEVGYVYVVKSHKDPNTGKISYIYTQLTDDKDMPIKIGFIDSGDTEDKVNTVKVLSYDTFVCLEEDASGNTFVTTLNSISDYHEQFRCASTPWIVSEIKGDGTNLQVKKLFRFHTISDGLCANEQVKISIANIRPDDGTFDVLVRDYNDSDGNPTILESYKGLTMVPGDSKYIGLQIGTLNGDYEAVSKYVLVEVIENDMTATCVPAGFLGYPVRDYSSVIENEDAAPTFVYNLIYDEDIKEKKQYFGLSDLKGVDIDMFYYKGKDAYTENYKIGYTRGFHMDSTLNDNVISQLPDVTVTVDGEPNMDVKWDAVAPNQPEGNPPRLASEDEMIGTIYEDVRLRKFTVYPYGGFDGWDPYRGARTTSDEFRANKYKGTIANGYGATFSKINDGTGLALSGNCITSDYYAFLAGANQFEIPEKYVINLFATPGIDYVNQNTLSREILEMIEEKRMDSIYVMTTPDKPYGASDVVDEMYTSSDVGDNLEDSSIDSYYAATYYPWVKFYDKENAIYINLPATKDVLRNMADVDNKRYPWYAPAGIERGNVECKRMHFFAKLEDEDNVYDERINPLKTFSQDGVKIWGNKTMYTGDTPMNRINVVRLMLYLRKLINESCRGLIFGQNDASMKDEFDSIVNPILAQIKKDRGITDYKLKSSQTPEEMDAHELTASLWVKPTPTLEYIEINMIVTPQGVSFQDL